MLTDILGFEDLGLVIKLLSHRKEIIPARTPVEYQGNGLLSRLHSKEDREEALRRQDYEHKHAPIRDRIEREGPHYPHIYKSHEAGNTLNAAGKKYALPVGSERKEHDVSYVLRPPNLRALSLTVF